MLSYLYRAYACGSSRKQQVAYFQRHKAADVCNNLIHFEKHIRRIPTLHFFTVYIEMEIQLLQVTTGLFQRNERADSRRVVKPSGGRWYDAAKAGRTR